MRLAGPAVAEVTTFDQGEVSCSTESYSWLRCQSRELTSCIMSFMIFGGNGLDRSTTFSQANYNDLLTGSRSQFQDLDSSLVKGFKVKRGKETQSETRDKETKRQSKF